MKFLFYSGTHIPDASTTGISNVLERLGHVCSRFQRQEPFPMGLIVSTAEMYRIDCFIFCGGREVSGEHIDRLRQQFPRAAFVMWNFDLMSLPDTWSWFQPLASRCDLSIQLDASEIAFWEAGGVKNRKYCRMGIDPLVERPYEGVITDEDRAKYSADVAFMGMTYEFGDRVQTINLVRRWCIDHGKTFKHWGTWTEYLLGADLAKMIALTKIHVGHEPACRRPFGMWSSRVYTVLAHGGFYLTGSVPGYDEQFTDGQHLAFCRSDEELLSGLESYLSADEKRAEIAKAGSQFVRTACSWEERIKDVIPEIEKILQVKRT